MEVDAAGQRRQQGCVRGVYLREKVLNIGARLEHERSSQFTVNGMLHDDVQNLHTVIHQNLQLFSRALRCMPAGQNGTMPPFCRRRQVIASWRSFDLLPTGAQDGYVLHQTLPADMKSLC